MTIGGELRSARQAAGLSQRELAARTRVAQPTVARIERGQVDPRWATVDILLAACGQRIVVEVDTATVADNVDAADWASVLANRRLTPTERIEKMLASGT